MDDALERALRTLLPPAPPALLRRFAMLWLAKRAGRVMPTLGDLDPLDMPWALDCIFVLRRRDDGVFAYHLVGEGMASRLGGSIRGKTAFEVFEPDYARWTERRWQRSAAERKACYVHTHHRTSDGVPLHAKRLLLPLAGSGERVDDLIGVTSFESWTGVDPEGGREVERTIWAAVASLPPTAGG